MNAGPPRIFDRGAYAQHRARGLRMDGDCFLAEEAATRLTERIMTVNRKFEFALDLSSRPQSFSLLKPLAGHWLRTSLSRGESVDLQTEEDELPFADASFDLVTSVLSLHAVNDLPGALIQIRRCLKPDGLFMAALFGDATLHELKDAFAQAEIQTSGGVSPRVAPFADVRALGGLLQRAGFALPVTDIERTHVRYSSFMRLIDDLRTLGETNALSARSRAGIGKATLSALITAYDIAHAGSDGKLRATFDIVYLTGWSPHESQQKPLKPGSAKSSLSGALGTNTSQTES